MSELKPKSHVQIPEQEEVEVIEISRTGLNMGEDSEKSFLIFLRQFHPISAIILGVITAGFMIGYPSILLPQLQSAQSDIKVSDNDASWIASIVGLGVLNGDILVPFVLNYFGRKNANILASLPSILAGIIIFFANSVPLLLFGRYLQGVLMGIQAPVVTMSIGEYASPYFRGLFMASINFSLSLGILVCHILGTFLSWRFTNVICTLFTVISIFIFCTSPESPAYLASIRNYDECRTSFQYLRGISRKGETELLDIIEKSSRKRRNKKESWWERNLKVLKQPAFYKPTVTLILLFCMSQFGGTNIVANYSVTIMTAVSGNTFSPYVAMIVADSVRFVASICALFTLKQFKIRTVLFTSVIFSASSILFAAIYLHMQAVGIIHSNSGYIPEAAVCIYVFSISSGIYIVPFTFMGELYRQDYKPLGGLICGITIAITMFLSLKLSHFLITKTGVHGLFYFFATVIVILASILWFRVPETKDMTLNEIEDYYAH